MKKFLVSSIAILVILCGCQKSARIKNDGGLVPILLGSKEVSATKAPVTTATTFTAQIVASTTDGDYSTEKMYKDALNNTLDKAADFTIPGEGGVRTGTFVGDPTPVFYYPSNGSSIYVKGYSPEDVTTNVVRAGSTVAYIITGDEDIMACPTVVASKATTSAIALAFKHLLTQVNFKVKADDAASITTWGKIKKIEILERPSHLNLDLSGTGTTEPTIAADVTSPTNIDVVSYDNATGVDLTVDATALGDPKMILPIASGTWTIKVTAANGTQTIDASSIALAAGDSNTITLNFKSTGITVSCTVTDWTPVDKGSVNVQ